jgi:hypothetical protein
LTGFYLGRVAENAAANFWTNGKGGGGPENGNWRGKRAEGIGQFVGWLPWTRTSGLVLLSFNSGASACLRAERTELEGQQVDEEEEVRDKDTLHLDWGGANFRANWAMRGWLPGDYEGQITRRMPIADICEIVYAK